MHLDSANLEDVKKFKPAPFLKELQRTQPF